MKKTKNTTFIPPTSSVDSADLHTNTEGEEAAKKSTATLHKKAPVKRPSKKTQTIPSVTAMPDDDQLQEALDEDLIYDEAPMDEPEELIPEENLTPTEQRQRKRQRSREQELSALDLIRTKSGLTENDVAMIFELGYENELGRLVGYENLKRLKNDHQRRRAISDEAQYRTAFGFRGEEYAGEQNQDTVAAAYQHDRKPLWLRMIGTLLLTVLLLFVDMKQLVEGYLPASIIEQPIILHLAGLLLVVATALLSFKQIRAGVYSLFEFQPTPYSVSAILLPFTLTYDVIGIWHIGVGINVNFLTALVILLTVVCDLFRFSCEQRTLELISCDGEKTVLVPATPRKKKLRQADKIVKIINDDLGETRYQVRKSLHTIGFFRRFNDMSTAAKPFCVFLSASLSLATVLAFVRAIYTNSFVSATSAFMVVLFLTLPVCSVFAYFYPLYRANRLLATRGCALIGEEAVEEYDRQKTVIFADTDLYTAEKCTEIAVRESDDFKEDMRLAGILFRKLGGTLTKLGEAAGSAKNDPPVAVTRILEAGVEAVIDNRYHVLAGDGEFMMRSGIRIPKESTDKVLRRSSDVSLMYVAINGVLKLSYEIEYGTKRPFERLIRDLADANCAVAISSYDPNLDTVFVQKSRAASTEPISVIKPNRWEEPAPLEIADAGAVSTKRPHDVVFPLHAAHAIGKTKRFAFRLQLISAILGATSAVLLTFFGLTDLLGILPIVGYQSLWILVCYAASLGEISPEKMHFPKKKQ